MFNKCIFTLTAYEAHRLLSDLENLLRIQNRDNTMTISLWEKIAQQLDRVVDNNEKKG